MNKIGEQEIRRVAERIGRQADAEQVPLDTVCFHCQQAAEKMLKALT